MLESETGSACRPQTPNTGLIMTVFLQPLAAITGYAISLWKLSANCRQLFVGAQAAKRLWQIISGFSFVTAHIAYTITNKTKLVWIETTFSTLGGLETPLVFTCVLRLCYFGYYKRNIWYNLSHVIVQELCESRGGRPGLSVLTSLLVSVDVKNYWTVLRHWSQLVPNMSTDIWGH